MIPAESKPTVDYGQENSVGLGVGLAVDAMLSDRRPDGSVHGSYDAKTMSDLLRYHAMQEVAPAAGSMMMGGERFDG